MGCVARHKAPVSVHESGGYFYERLWNGRKN